MWELRLKVSGLLSDSIQMSPCYGLRVPVGMVLLSCGPSAGSVMEQVSSVRGSKSRLSIVKASVDKDGGWSRLESEPAAGSRFSLLILAMEGEPTGT